MLIKNLISTGPNFYRRFMHEARRTSILHASLLYSRTGTVFREVCIKDTIIRTRCNKWRRLETISVSNSKVFCNVNVFTAGVPQRIVFPLSFDPNYESHGLREIAQASLTKPVTFSFVIIVQDWEPFHFLSIFFSLNYARKKWLLYFNLNVRTIDNFYSHFFNRFPNFWHSKLISITNIFTTQIKSVQSLISWRYTRAQTSNIEHFNKPTDCNYVGGNIGFCDADYYSEALSFRISIFSSKSRNFFRSKNSIFSLAYYSQRK